jgi:3-deoxy-D-manno-octulosonate 8-phosphate phosphatase (KDO 8-P phosphatase)
MDNSCGTGNDKGYPSDCELTEGLRSLARNRPKDVSIDMQTLIPKAQAVKLLLLDVDGVLTDGTLIFSQDGEESKTFNTQDGFGLRLLQEAGVDVGIITARTSKAVAKRAENLKLNHLYMGESNKLTAYQDILKKTSFKPFEISYMGDDWLDLVLLKRVGFAISPANGVDEVKDIAHLVTEAPGGHGGVREACNFILKSKGIYLQLLQKYMNR